MTSRDECLARAVELEAKMLETPYGIAREEYAHLAAQWRMLADIAGHAERSTFREEAA